MNMFGAFKAQHNKVYATPQEEAFRYGVFVNNMKIVDELNAKEPNAIYAATKFSDLTTDEFAQTYLNYRPADLAAERQSMPVVRSSQIRAPASFDWATKGAVTPVKNQGSCGSCWAFSAVETLESAYFLAGKGLHELSTQQVVSCDKIDGGCNGGDTVQAYKYMLKNALQTEESYPYTSGRTGSTGSCQANPSEGLALMTNWTYATAPCFGACNNQDEEDLANNLASTAPVSVCVYASSWQFYNGGVMTSNCPYSYNVLNHCVQLTGLDTTKDGVRYWRLRNSWGTSWGEQGYIYTKIGTNLCGVADEATFVFA